MVHISANVYKVSFMYFSVGYQDSNVSITRLTFFSCGAEIEIKSAQSDCSSIKPEGSTVWRDLRYGGILSSLSGVNNCLGMEH